MNAAVALLAASKRIDRLDAEILLAHLAGVDRMTLLTGPNIEIDEVAYDALVARRAAHEPVAYITGHREFWSLDIAVTPDVLIPRPDSETLIEAAKAARGDHAPATVLDLGTGSGALLLAALSEWPRARGLGIDRSAAALAVARGNADRLGFGRRTAFQAGDWARGVTERFDLVLANPPYVEDGAILAPDVGDFEPASALFAGADGLDAYRDLVPQLPGLLNPSGVAVVEIGATQADGVADLMAAAGLTSTLRRDLAGHDRCLIARRT